MMPTDKHRQSVSIRYGVLQMPTDKFKISNWEKNIAQDVIPGDIFCDAESSGVCGRQISLRIIFYRCRRNTCIFLFRHKCGIFRCCNNCTSCPLFPCRFNRNENKTPYNNMFLYICRYHCKSNICRQRRLCRLQNHRCQNPLQTSALPVLP